MFGLRINAVGTVHQVISYEVDGNRYERWTRLWQAPQRIYFSDAGARLGDWSDAGFKKLRVMNDAEMS